MLSGSLIVRRMVAAAMITGGLSMLAAGASETLYAVDCTQGAWIEPAECVGAHVDTAPSDRVLGTNSGCSFNGGTTCSAVGSGCSVTPAFNNAEKGKCQAFIGGCEITKCAADFYKTAITLTKVVGACDSVNGDCACRYSAAMPAETTTVEVCNCKQEKV